MDVYCLAWFLLLVAQGAACKILIRLQAGVQVLVDGAFYGLAITQAVYTCDCENWTIILISPHQNIVVLLSICISIIKDRD